MNIENKLDVIIENKISDNCVILTNNRDLYETNLLYNELSNITNKN